MTRSQNRPCLLMTAASSRKKDQQGEVSCFVFILKNAILEVITKLLLKG